MLVLLSVDYPLFEILVILYHQISNAAIEEVKELNYTVTPGRYVGLQDDEDDFNLAERFNSLKAELEKQI